MKKKLFALSGVFLIVLVIAGLWATQATDIYGVQEAPQPMASMASGMPMEQMARDAELIVIGDCTGTQSQWAGRNLYTLATVSVTESFKGDATGTLTVAIPGGVDSNRRFPIAMTYAGAPTFAPGEEVIVFLDAAQSEIPNSYAVMGFSLGKFSVNQDTQGGKVVTRDLTKAPVQRGPGAIRGNLQAIPLLEFKEWLRKVLNN